MKHFITPNSIFHNTAGIKGYGCCQRNSNSSTNQEDYWESEWTTASNRPHYIRLGLRLLCPMTEAAVFTMHTEGSPEVDLVLLPGSCENNASQKITKEEVSGKTEDVGTRIKEHCTPTNRRKLQKTRDIEESFFFLMPYICFRKVFLPVMHHSVFGYHGSFCLQKQKCFIIKGLFADSKLESFSHSKLLLPGIVLLQRLPKSPTLSLYRKRQRNYRKWRMLTLLAFILCSELVLKLDPFWSTVYLL